MSMLYGSGSDDAPYRELKFERAEEGEVNFLVDRKSGFNHSSTFETLNRYFTEEFLTKYAFDVSYKGGRGSTMLFALPYENAVLMYGPKKDPTLVNQHASSHVNSNDIPVNLKANGGPRSGASLKSSSFMQPSSPSTSEGNAKSTSHPQRVSTLGTDSADGEATPSYYILCLRPYLRGGLIGKIMKDNYLRLSETALRARNEFCLLQRLYKMGLPVPRPLIAREQIGFMFVKNSILIEQIPNTNNLAELMRKDELNIEHLLAVGTTLKRFFTREVMHTDLNIRNILIDNENKCFIIDFDKCYIKQDFSESDCDRMLSRLERSFKKELTAILDDKDSQNISEITSRLIEPIRNAALGIEVDDPSELLIPSLSKKDESSEQEEGKDKLESSTDAKMSSSVEGAHASQNAEAPAKNAEAKSTDASSKDGKEATEEPKANHQDELNSSDDVKKESEAKSAAASSDESKDEAKTSEKPAEERASLKKTVLLRQEAEKAEAEKTEAEKVADEAAKAETDEAAEDKAADAKDESEAKADSADAYKDESAKSKDEVKVEGEGDDKSSKSRRHGKLPRGLRKSGN